MSLSEQRGIAFKNKKREGAKLIILVMEGFPEGKKTPVIEAICKCRKKKYIF